MAAFDKVLDRQNPQEIKKVTQQLETILNNLDTEDWL
jgi:hypothetical protein